METNKFNKIKVKLKKYNKLDLLYFIFIFILVVIFFRSLLLGDEEHGLLLAIATTGIAVLKKIK